MQTYKKGKEKYDILSAAARRRFTLQWVKRRRHDSKQRNEYKTVASKFKPEMPINQNPSSVSDQIF